MLWRPCEEKHPLSTVFVSSYCSPSDKSFCSLNLLFVFYSDKGKSSGADLQASGGETVLQNMKNVKVTHPGLDFES